MESSVFDAEVHDVPSSVGRISCMTIFDRTLLLGASDGTMSVLDVDVDGALRLRSSVSRLGGSKGPISKMRAVLEWKILLAVVQGRLLAFELVEDFAKRVDGLSPSDIVDDEFERVSRVADFAEEVEDRVIAIVVKDGVVLLNLQERMDFKSKSRFAMLQKFAFVHSPPLQIEWAGREHLAIGFEKEYLLIRAYDGSEIKKPRQKTGQRRRPLMCRVQDAEELLFGKDRSGYFVGFDGLPSRAKISILWSEEPTHILSCPPFIVSTMPKGIEVHLSDSCKRMQVIRAPGFALATIPSEYEEGVFKRTILGRKELPYIFVAKDSKIVQLRMRSFDEMINAFLETGDDGDCKAALELCEAASKASGSSTDLREQVELQRASIHARHALHFFSEKSKREDFETAYGEIEQARETGRLPLEFVFMLFSRTDLFDSPQAALTMALNFSDLRTELREKLVASQCNLQSTGPGLALCHEPDRLIPLSIAENTEDLRSMGGPQFSNALLSFFLPYMLQFRQNLLNFMSSIEEKGDTNLGSLLTETFEFLDTVLLRAFVLHDAFAVRTSIKLEKSKHRPSNSEGIRAKALTAKMMERKMDFLRGKNWCNVRECELLLLSYPEMWEELLWLYYGKDMHDQALRWLQKLQENHDREDRSFDTNQGLRTRRVSSSQYMNKTVEYLRRLGSENQATVFEFASWIVASCEVEDSLAIFQSHPSVEKRISPVQVLRFLKGEDLSFMEKSVQSKTMKLIAARFIDEEIFEQENDDPGFHQESISTLIDLIRKSDETDGLHSHLVKLLERSQKYDSEKIAIDIADEKDIFVEEFSILLSKLSRHSEAILMLLEEDASGKLAEAYCTKNYQKDDPERKDIFVTLVREFFRAGRQQAALDLMQNHVNQLDSAQALQLLPDDASLHVVQPFLSAKLRALEVDHRELQVLKQILKKEELILRQDLSSSRRQYSVISAESTCVICKHHFTPEQPIARFPSGSISHYSCFKE